MKLECQPRRGTSRQRRPAAPTCRPRRPPAGPAPPGESHHPGPAPAGRGRSSRRPRSLGLRRALGRHTAASVHHRRRCQPASVQIRGQLAPPEHPEQHRQHRHRVTHGSRPVQQRCRLGEHHPQPLHQRRLCIARMPVARQPAQIRRMDRVQLTDPLILPAHLRAKLRGSSEHHRVPVTDPLIRTDIDDHPSAVRTARKVVRACRSTRPEAVSAQYSHIGCAATPTTSGSASRAISRSRSSQDSWPTSSPVLANHHQPGRFRCPRNQANPRTGKTRSNATHQQRLNGSRRTIPSASMNSASATAPDATAPGSDKLSCANRSRAPAGR